MDPNRLFGRKLAVDVGGDRFDLSRYMTPAQAEEHERKRAEKMAAIDAAVGEFVDAVEAEIEPLEQVEREFPRHDPRRRRIFHELPYTAARREARRIVRLLPRRPRARQRRPGGCRRRSGAQARGAARRGATRAGPGDEPEGEPDGEDDPLAARGTAGVVA